MEWMEKGVVRLPLKYLYLVTLVLVSSYFLAREISTSGRKRRHARCEHLEQAVPPAAQTRFKTSQQGDDVPGREEAVCTDNHFRKTACPRCFRSQAYSLSKKLQPVSDSSLKFPRGPPGLFLPRRTRQQEFLETYVITPWAVCTPGLPCPYLLAVQLSILADIEKRNAVRSTWGSVAKTQAWPNANINSRVQLLFVLAHQQSSKPPSQVSNQSEGFKQKTQWNLLKDEASLHGDVLFIDMQDSYSNLSLKLMSAFKWVRDNCPAVKFILKVDTDTFVNVPLLLDLLLLNENRLQYSVTGHLYTKEKTVHRQGKWKLDDPLYPPPIYPVYASGCSYVVSVSALGQMVELLPFMSMDHLSTFLGPDYFITGVMGVPLALEFFDVPSRPVFAACNGTKWRECDLIYDSRVFAPLDHSTGSSTRLARIWAAFFKYNVEA